MKSQLDSRNFSNKGFPIDWFAISIMVRRNGGMNQIHNCRTDVVRLFDRNLSLSLSPCLNSNVAIEWKEIYLYLVGEELLKATHDIFTFRGPHKKI